MKRKFLAAFLVTTLCLTAALAGAAEPVGRQLTQKFTTSLTVGASYNFTFALYDAATGGNKVWEEGPVRYKVASGKAVTHALGKLNGFDAGVSGPVDFSRELWAQAATGTKAWRVPLKAVPYAHAAAGLRMEPSATSPNLVGGHDENAVAAGKVGAVIVGGGKAADPLDPAAPGPNFVGGAYGGDYGFIGAGFGNQITGDNGFVGAGYDNRACCRAAVAGGAGNTAGQGSFVGAGGGNQALGDSTVIGGGDQNQISSGSYLAVIGGGEMNVASAPVAAVLGGSNNAAQGEMSVVGGGRLNTASGLESAILGGSNNRAEGVGSVVVGGGDSIASGQVSIVVGGCTSRATEYGTLAAGEDARASRRGMFVWSASDEPNPQVFEDDGFFPTETLNLDPPVENSLLGDRQFWVKSPGGVFFVIGQDEVTRDPIGVKLVDASGWQPIVGIPSDANLKTGIEEVDARALLEKVAALPVRTWSYKGNQKGTRHIGPMAQDFSAAFGVGEDDRHINPVDGAGVSLAAIQALYAMVRELHERVAAQDRELAEGRAQATALGARLEDLQHRYAELRTLLAGASRDTSDIAAK